MKEIHQFAALAFLALAACTTQKTEPEPGPTPEPVASESVILTNETDSPVSLSYQMSASWHIENCPDWLNVAPTSGFDGDNEIQLSAKSLNENIMERVGYFDIIINDQDAPVRIYVIQKGSVGAEFVNQSITAGSEEATISIEVLTNTEISAEFDNDWASVSGIEFLEDEILLEDDKTVSEVRTAVISLDLTDNPDLFNSREGIITLKSDGSSDSATLVQNAKAFYRRTLAMRFTATWCGNCPMMAESFKIAMEENPRIVPMTIHGSTSELFSDDANRIMNFYGVTGYPTGVVNSIAQADNYPTEIASVILTGLADEAVELLPAKTAISCETETTAGRFSVSGSLATKEALKYNIHVYLVEDGVIYPQESYDQAYPGGNNYEHNYVERCAVTEVRGDEIQGVDKGYVDFSFEYDIPDGRFENSDNAYAIIYVTYDNEKTFRGSVEYAKYINYGQIVDNVIKVPLNGKIDYEYEK